MSRLYKEGNRLHLVLNKRERKTLTHIRNRSEKPKAQRSCNVDTRGGVVAALNAVDGQLIYKIASKINVPCFCAFLRHLKEMYPDAEQIYMVLDNWLVARNEAITNTHKHFLLSQKQELCLYPVRSLLVGNDAWRKRV